MNTPILSIIVPVYNVEQYVGRCLDSILSQTFTDFELILVDDGSKDMSGKICDEYAERDNRIRLFHRENHGVSSSRNFAIGQAKGEYVTFVDADDWLDVETLSLNISILLENKKYDILQFPCHRINDNGEVIGNYSVESPILYTEKQDIFISLVEDGPITWSVWGKIFKKNIYRKLHFNEKMSVNEDLYVLVEITDFIECVYISNVGNYLYYYRDGSASTGECTPLRFFDHTRTRVLIFQKACLLEMNMSKFWADAVRMCINAWSYYGPCEELKNYLKLLANYKVGMHFKCRKRIIKLAQLISPLMAARIKRLMVRVFHLNKY